MSLMIPQQSRENFTQLEYSSTNCLGGGLASYGERIRRAHKEWELAHDKELPWAQVARECQRILKRAVDPATMNRWKTGKQEPSLEEFRALATVLEASPAALAFGDQPEERVYVKPYVPTTPKELQKPRATRRKGNG